jgi:PAS domain S-box-containing protein
VIHRTVAGADELLHHSHVKIGTASGQYTILIRKNEDNDNVSIAFAPTPSAPTEQLVLQAVQLFIAEIEHHQSLESLNHALQTSLRSLNLGVFCALTQEPQRIADRSRTHDSGTFYDFLGIWVFGHRIPIEKVADSKTISRLLGITELDHETIDVRKFFDSILDPTVSQKFTERFSMAGLNHVISFPLHSRNKVIGILSFMGPFVTHDALRHIATYLHFIHGMFAQLYERAMLEAQVVRLQRLNRSISSLSQITQSEGFFEHIARACVDIFDVHHAFVLLKDADDHAAQIVVSVGAEVDESIPYLWHVVSPEPQRVVALHVTVDPFLVYLQTCVTVKVALIVPLVQAGQCYGAIYMTHPHEEFLSPNDLVYAEQFGEYVSNAYAKLTLAQSLDRSEKRYRLLLNESSNPVLVVNRYDQVLHINHAGRRFVGIDDESTVLLSDVLALKSTSMWHHERERLIRREVDKVFWQGEALNVMRQTKTPFEAEVICVQQSDGHIEFLITFHDITDRLHAEQQHRLRENELDLFQHITSVVNSSLDLDELLERALDIFEEVGFGSMYGILLLDENRAPYLAAHRHLPIDLLNRLQSDPIALRGGIDLVLSSTEQKDYTSVVSVKSILNNELIAQFGNLIGAKISVDDKTIGAVLASRPFLSAPDFTPRDMQILHAVANQLARGITNARLHHSLQVAADRNSMLYNDAEKTRAHLSSVIENSPDALVLLQRESWSMRVLNEDPFVLWGYGYGSLQQKSLQSICAPDQITVMNEHLARIGIHPSYSFECGMLRADGSQFTALISANTVNADEVLLSIRDITPMRMLESRIKQREKLALLGQMIATVAHELNNPIAVIRGIAQLQLMQPLAPEQKRDIEVIERTSHRAARIVQQLRMLGQPHKIEFVEVDVRELVEHIATQYRPLFAQSDIDFHMDAPEPEYLIFGDTAQIEQVLINLIDNAIRAMQHIDRQRVLTLRLDATNFYVNLHVEDTGTGIDIGARTRLFEPFYSTRTVGDGLGLGLAIVHTIVTQHHGTIEYENRQTGGTRFTITLPTRKAPRLTIAKQTVASDTYLTIIELLREMLKIPIIEVDTPDVPADMLVIDATLLSSYPDEVLAHRLLCIMSPRDMQVPQYPDVTAVVCTMQMDASLLRQQLQLLVSDLLLP